MVMRGGHGAAAPQISSCLAAVGFTSSDGNIGRSKFKDQLINKLTRKLKRLHLEQVATDISMGLLAADENIIKNSIDRM